MKVIKKIIFVVILVAISISLLVIGNGYNMYKEALEQMPLSKKVASIREKENYAKIDEIPQIYKNAVISVEDHRFYKHNGIDIIAIVRAFTQEKKITRKIAEVFMVFEIEKEYDKNQILELYLNTSYFGDGYYTVKEACKGYFNKELKEMTDYECILLAGIPNAPSVYAPTKNPELAIQRQKQVMNKMVEYEYLTQEEANKILEQNGY